MAVSGHKLGFVDPERSQPTAFDSLARKIREWKSDYVHRNLIFIGSKPGPEAIRMASNDYLALDKDPRIASAIADAVLRSDQDVFMTSVYTQYLAIQQAYEAEVARYLAAEAAVLCQSGWAANDGLVQALVDDETVVYIDLYAHASLWRGVHSGGATPRPFRHNDPASLEAFVRCYGAGLIVVDTVYSTTGAVCPLKDIVEIAEAYGCMILADESHAIGVRGPQGAGLAAQLGLADRIHFRTFSLSKALVGRGGMVVGPARELEFFRFSSRPSIFSSAVLPYEIAGFSAALDAARTDAWRREALHENTAYLKAGLRSIGVDIADNDSPIIALVGGLPEQTVALRDALEARNVFGSLFCAPATPKNRSLMRMTLNAAMQRAELDRIVEVCAAVKRETGII